MSFDNELRMSFDNELRMSVFVLRILIDHATKKHIHRTTTRQQTLRTIDKHETGLGSNVPKDVQKSDKMSHNEIGTQEESKKITISSNASFDSFLGNQL